MALRKLGKIGFLALVLLSLPGVQAAVAAGPENIDGVTPRLLSVRCQSAYVMKLKAFRELAQNLCSDIDGGEALTACLKAELHKVAKLDTDAVLAIQAIPGQKNFTARVESEGHEIFRSIRQGFHGDGRDSITLFFARAGLGMDDPYLLELGELSNDGKRARSAFVPVRRQLLSDMAYIFLDPCSLEWEAT